jgi:hypothetical protein
MRFKVGIPIHHPKYTALRQRSESFATLWGVGHSFFLLFGVLGCCMPGVIALIFIIDPDTLRGRVWSTGVATVSVCLLVALLGIVLRRYAWRKGFRAS